MPTQLDEIAKVYARSLFELAEKDGGEARLGEAAAELEAIAEMIRSDASLREFLASPIIDGHARGAALGRIFEGRVSPLVRRFLMVVNAHGRSGHLASISDAFDLLMQERFGRVEVDVFTVTGGRLEPAIESAITARIKAAVGREPVLHSYADPHMIGGIKLRVGDQLIDGSIAMRLRRLSQALHERGRADFGRDLNTFVI